MNPMSSKRTVVLLSLAAVAALALAVRPAAAQTDARRDTGADAPRPVADARVSADGAATPAADAGASGDGAPRAGDGGAAADGSAARDGAAAPSGGGSPTAAPAAPPAEPRPLRETEDEARMLGSRGTMAPDDLKKSTGSCSIGSGAAPAGAFVVAGALVALALRSRRRR